MMTALAILVMAATLWSLFREHKSLPRTAWLALAALRLSAVGLIFWAAGGKCPAWFRPSGRPPVLALVIDASRSMKLTDGQESSRWQRALSWAQGAGPKVARYQYGARGLEPLADQPPEFSEATDLLGALKAAAGQGAGAVVLLSDGNHNAGGDPVAGAAALGIPIHPVGVGQPFGGPVAGLSWVDAPEAAEPGQHLEVEAVWQGLQKPASLLLTDERSRVVARRELGLSQERITLGFIAGQAGLHRYRLSLVSGSDTLDQRSLAVKVRREGIKVLCLSGQPGWELRFLLQAMAPAGRLKPEAWVWRTGGWARAGGDADPDGLVRSLKGAEVVLLHNLRSGMFDRAWEDVLLNRVKEGRAGLLLLGSEWLTDFRQRPLFQASPLPPADGRGGFRGRARLTEYLEASGILDPLAAQGLRESVSRLSPLEIGGRPGPARPEAVILGQLDDKGQGRPFWAWQGLGRGRAMQIAASQLWPWSLSASGMLGDSLSYGAIITGSLNWLGGGQGQNLSLETDRGFYHPGESVSFIGWSALPEKLREKARWSLELAGPDGKRQNLAPSLWGRDQFLARAQDLPLGEYTYRASLKVEGRTLGQASGKFWVEPFPGQEREPWLNQGLLSELARVTGGRFARLDSCPGCREHLSGLIPARPREPGGSCWPAWLLAILLLCAEWLGRRRFGLS